MFFCISATSQTIEDFSASLNEEIWCSDNNMYVLVSDGVFSAFVGGFWEITFAVRLIARVEKSSNLGNRF